MPSRSSLPSLDEDREASPALQMQDLRGTLYLVARKTGVDMQEYPIDGERVTIGR